MNDEEQKNLWQGLKCLWQEHKPSGDPTLAAGEQIAAMRKKMAKMHPGLNKTDFWGSALYAVVTVPFIVYVFTTPFFVTRIGYLILIGGGLFASWKTFRRRRSTPQPIADAPVLEWLKYDLAKVRQHAEDSRTLLWWYLLPFLIGMSVSTWGMPVDLLTVKVPMTVLAALIAGVTYWLNQRVWRNQWLPMQRELEALLAPDQPVLQPEPPKKNIMTKTILIGIVLILLGAIVFVRAREPKTPAIEYSDPVSQMLENIRVKHNFPALAAAVVVDGKTVVTNAVGFRKNGGTEKVAVDDKFHLGSVTKSMTATVAAMLVEQGRISWTTTVGEAFPELKSEIHPDYSGVTLEQLLSHRGGAPGDAPGDLWRKAWTAKGTAAEQRLAFIQGILTRKPEAKPGTKYIYSNQGYTIAGVMLEKATGKTWEELLRSMLFEPLGMTTAGFGAPASLSRVDQPWGHTKAPLSGFAAVPPGPRADNPLAISPAGAVHCSMGDLAKYAAFHMAGERGKSALLKAESFRKLHTAVADNDDYALGWRVLKRPWANRRALMHNGSNTMFYVVVWMAPERNCAVIVAANIGVDEAFAGCDEVAGKLIKQYFGK
ncbi:MAG TPA: serine hydrolase domain-containing protein [Verrucomicrobiae bacterium]|nr:serine hydrolase domain-containing protein [Verrucomicrobiae bacterium]